MAQPPNCPFGEAAQFALLPCHIGSAPLKQFINAGSMGGQNLFAGDMATVLHHMTPRGPSISDDIITSRKTQPVQQLIGLQSAEGWVLAVDGCQVSPGTHFYRACMTSNSLRATSGRAQIKAFTS